MGVGRRFAMTDAPVTIDAIREAGRRIAGKVRETPVNASPSLTELTGQPVHLKFEHLQITGAFKLRGATNAIACLGEDQRRRGVATASTGNHGRAVAQAARESCGRTVVCMSNLVPQVKVDAIRALGAEVRIVGQSQDDAQAEVDRMVAEEGLTSIPPFDHADVIAGQGTLGLEIAEQVPDIALALIPLSGGGLIAGVAAALKAVRPGVRVVGISMERGAAMAASLNAGYALPVEELPTLADSLGGGIGLENRYTFQMVRDLVDDVELLSEAEIADAMRHLYRKERQVVEGAAAVGVAALLARKVKPDGPTVALLSGGNVDMEQHFRVMSGADE